MKFASLVVALLSGVALASPFAKRTATGVINDISTVAADFDTIGQNIQTFTGTVAQGLALVAELVKVDADIKTATSEAKSTGTLDTGDSETIASDATILGVQIVGILTDLDAKNATVKSAGQNAEFEAALKTLQPDADALFAALQTTIAAPSTEFITSARASVASAFATAIALF